MLSVSEFQVLLVALQVQVMRSVQAQNAYQTAREQVTSSASTGPTYAHTTSCTGLGWDRVNVLHSSWFQICAENSVDKIGMF